PTRTHIHALPTLHLAATQGLPTLARTWAMSGPGSKGPIWPSTRGRPLGNHSTTVRCRRRWSSTIEALVPPEDIDITASRFLVDAFVHLLEKVQFGQVILYQQPPGDPDDGPQPGRAHRRARTIGVCSPSARRPNFSTRLRALCASTTNVVWCPNRNGTVLATAGTTSAP